MRRHWNYRDFSCVEGEGQLVLGTEMYHDVFSLGDEKDFSDLDLQFCPAPGESKAINQSINNKWKNKRKYKRI